MVTTNNSPEGLYISLVAVIIGGSIYLVLALRAQRKKQEHRHNFKPKDLETKNQIYKDLPKFWTLPVVLGLFAGLGLIAFGIEYFWNTSGITPETYLWSGFGVVMLGAIVSIVSFSSAALPRAREIERRRRTRQDTK